MEASEVDISAVGGEEGDTAGGDDGDFEPSRRGEDGEADNEDGECSGDLEREDSEEAQWLLLRARTAIGSDISGGALSVDCFFFVGCPLL